MKINRIINSQSYYAYRGLKHLFAILFCLGLTTPSWAASVSIVAGEAGVAKDVDGELIVAVPLSNTGTGIAIRVMLDKVHLHGAHRTVPVELPLPLADLSGDSTDVVDLSFMLKHLEPNEVLELKLEGRYQSAGRGDDDDEHDSNQHRGRDGRNSRDREDEESHEHEWHAKVRIDLAQTGPITGTSGSGIGTTHQTMGPYPPLPIATQGEADQDATPPIPHGKSITVFPVTAKPHPAMDPQIKSFPGVTPDGAVGFVVNTGRGTGLPFPMDPNAVAPGGTQQLAMASGNTFLQISTDGGKTFPTVITNFSTIFGDSPDAGYCCDQVLHYIPSIDRVVWLIQTNQPNDGKNPPTPTGPNRQRIAWAKPTDIVANVASAWTWFDLTPAFLGQPANDFFDYSDLAVSNGYLYVSFDSVGSGGLIVTRISLADMQKPGGSQVIWDFTRAVDGKTSYGSHLTQHATGTMYWGGHPSDNQLQVCHWGDGSNQYGCENHNHNSFERTAAKYASQAPDGQYWLAPQFQQHRTMSAVRRPGEIWFSWMAGRDTTFPHPYAAILKLHEDTLEPFDELEVWNPGHAYAYPALSVNSQTSEVAISLLWGGGNKKFFQNHAVGFLGDFVVWITTSSDVTLTTNTPGISCQDASFVGNPANRCTRSGDYLGVRRLGNSSGLFVTAGYEVKLGDTTKAVDCLAAGQTCSETLRYVEFGRPADTGGDGIPRPPR